MKIILIFATYAILSNTPIIKAVETSGGVSTGDVNPDNKEVNPNDAGTATVGSTGDANPDNKEVIPNDAGSNPGFPPLMISLNKTETIAHILNVSYTDRPVFFVDEKFLFACSHLGVQNIPKELRPLTANWMYVKDIHIVVKHSDNEIIDRRIQAEQIEHVQNYNTCLYPVVPSFIEVYGESIEQRYHKIFAIGFEIQMHQRFKDVNKNEVFYKYLMYSHLRTIIQEGFQWFNVLVIQFDSTKLNVKNVFYKMNEYLPDLLDSESDTISVENHTLGHKLLFGSVNIAELYEIDNQKIVFSKLFPDETERSKYFDIEAQKILVPAHLAPLDVYTIPHIKQAAKTFGNVAPMWKVIRDNGWKNVEQYLHLVAQVIKRVEEKKDPSVVLEVISGTYGALEFPAGEPISLDSDQVNVPSAFYKLVMLKLKDIRYDILIVTINNPYKDTSGILCKHNQCEKFGWKAVQNDDYTKGRTICCQINKDILKSLLIKEEYFPNFENVLDLKAINALSSDPSKPPISLEMYIEDHGKHVQEIWDEIKERERKKNEQ